MSTNRTGICHICGNDGPLSYEHIPPRSMGNSKPVKSYRVADIAEKHGSTNVKFTIVNTNEVWDSKQSVVNATATSADTMSKPTQDASANLARCFKRQRTTRTATESISKLATFRF